ncbi:MAG: class D beta-lactamase, partial [Alphaproteobacteria bacterium]|nr:class D beta-lactamase [Alphaproteobacteria bacterium]
MYKFVLLCSLVTANSALADMCFIAKENGKVVKQEGECEKRHSPFSSFKIPIALMGFDSGILKNENSPKVDFTEETRKNFEPWYFPHKYPIQMFSARSQTPSSWMKYSVVWFSQYVTVKLGMEKFQDYVNKFEYGNKDISGDKGKNNGLMNSWIQSSIQISPIEQVNFIEKLSNKNLPISKQAQEQTIKIIKLEDVWDDWKLYGKTGGSKTNGWFIGWVEKDGRTIQFAQYLAQPADSLMSGGRVAKEIAKDNLITLML